MDVTALGGPHDGDTIAIDSKIRTIQFMIEPERPAGAAEVEIESVTYRVVRWYTGRDDEGRDGRMMWIVLTPEHWPKAGPDRPLYPPPGFRG